MLVGVAPQTRHYWTKCPEVMTASPALSRPLLIPAGGRDPQKMVDVRLDGQGLPHIPIDRVVLCIEGLFSAESIHKSGQYQDRTGAGHRKIPPPTKQAPQRLKISGLPRA